MSGSARFKDRGFTLVELLVAMTILSILVMICLQFFSKARTVWDTGSRIVDANLKGRAVADFIAQEVSQALNTNFSVNASTIDFYVLAEVAAVSEPAIRHEIFDASTLGTVTFKTATTNDLCKLNSGDSVAFFAPPTNGLPPYVDVNVTLVSSDGKVTNFFQSRASFPNRYRYKF